MIEYIIAAAYVGANIVVAKGLYDELKNEKIKAKQIKREELRKYHAEENERWSSLIRNFKEI